VFSKEPDIHVADVKILKRGYAAACATCDWAGPKREDPGAALEDARWHEANPRPAPARPAGRPLRRIRRRLLAPGGVDSPPAGRTLV